MEKQQELEKYGYNVIHINTGEKAVTLLKENKQIDLILMDISLGNGIDGTETAALILKEDDIPVVFLSSHTEPEIVEKTERITSYGYVVKSSSITILDASIKMAFKLFEANKKIKESDKKQKTMLSNISDVIGIIGVDGIIKYNSPNIEKWFGWYPEDLVGTNGFKNIHPDDLERIQKAFAALLESDNSTTTVECRYKCKDETFKPIELTATNLTKDPLINGVLLNTQDITKRKRVEDKLKKSEELMRTMFEKSPLGIALVNSKTLEVREGNQRFAEILGISREKMVNVDWVQVTHPDDIEEDLDNMALLYAGKILEFKMEKRYIRPDGSIVWVNMMITSVETEANQHYHLCMVEDITERKRAEKEIKQQLLEKEIILKEVHHRIKNNFYSIVNLLSLQGNATDNEEVKTALI
ncbi:MAG: PAS domain S-box protein [Spirochaetales bacterium]|nr:PAS domain S-box protein [Spirochaetales bacterium]